MSTKKIPGLPAGLERVRGRFQRWRQTRKVRSPIPEPLWASAAKMAGMCGIHQTAKTLRVNYYSLKKRVEQVQTAGPEASAGTAPVKFLELAPPSPASSCECTVEFEDADGAKMRVHLKGPEPPDLASLSRSFWSPGP